MSGYILVHRGVFSHPVFKDEPYTETQAWLWLISQACFKPHQTRYKSQMIDLKIGEIPTSYRKLQERFSWGMGKTRNFIKLLETQHMVGTRTDTGFLIITICNYEQYQDPSQKSGTQNSMQTERKRNASGTQTERTEYKEKKTIVANNNKPAPDFLIRLQEIINSAIPMNMHPVWAWMEAGATEELILDVVGRIMQRRQGDPPGSMRFFDKAISQAISETNRKLEVAHGASDDRARAWLGAIDQHTGEQFN